VVYTQGERVCLLDPASGFRSVKTIEARDVRWTVTDTDISPDQRFIVYTSINSTAHLCNIVGDYDLHDALEFGDHSQYRFGIWCCRFNGDGTELVAGGNDNNLYVYDVVHKQVVQSVEAHFDDINSVCFADASPKCNVIFTASDDTLLKVWDRRTLGPSGRAAGVLTGHTEGLTFVSSKGDGRYVVTNGKDQTAKLWDIRMMQGAAVPAPRRYRWDYRILPYPGTTSPHLHPNDVSLMTYRGHMVLVLEHTDAIRVQVLETLIRVYFSPLATTGQQYIYTGSRDGCVYVYETLTGKLVHRLPGQEGVVRDVSWHPYEPSLCSVSWDGTVVLRSFPQTPFRVPEPIDGVAF